MTRIIYASQNSQVDSKAGSGEALWLNKEELEKATGWVWKPEGLCRDETCIPIPPNKKEHLILGERLDAAGMWRHLDWPLTHDRSGDIWVLGEGASQRAAALTSLKAPDFELPDTDDRKHRLSDYRGNRVFMFSWASWCGCRADLTMWQSLYAEFQNRKFIVLAIALDNSTAAAPWISAASPEYPCLIDSNHVTAELYNLVNVPQAIWIDEEGRIVRPPETAGSTDGFRSMDRKTFAMPQPAVDERERVKKAYYEAVRDWAANGAASKYVLDAQAAMAG